jgi:hypothetical protein
MPENPVKKLNYVTKTFSLATARTDFEVIMEGLFDHLAVLQVTGTASIRLNNKDRDSIDLTLVRSFNTPYDKFYLTNTAQTDGSLILECGGDASFETIPVTQQSHDFVYTVAGQASTNALADIIPQTYCGDGIGFLIFLGESGGVNGVTFAVFGSSIGSTWQQLGVNVVVPLSQTAYVAISDKWRYLKVQVIDTIGGNHGTAFASLHKLRA